MATWPHAFVCLVLWCHSRQDSGQQAVCAQGRIPPKMAGSSCPLQRHTHTQCDRAWGRYPANTSMALNLDCFRHIDCLLEVSETGCCYKHLAIIVTVGDNRSRACGLDRSQTCIETKKYNIVVWFSWDQVQNPPLTPLKNLMAIQTPWDCGL